jgi:hypothetical protein
VLGELHDPMIAEPPLSLRMSPLELFAGHVRRHGADRLERLADPDADQLGRRAGEVERPERPDQRIASLARAHALARGVRAVLGI